jgi:hypothetical protein
MAEPQSTPGSVKIPSSLLNRCFDWGIGLVGAPKKLATLSEEVKRLNERLDSAVERINYLEGRLETFTKVIDTLDQSVNHRIRLQILEHENGKK